MSRRVLIADDSALMRRMVGDTLAADGWEVVAQAATGEEAIAKYAQYRPDVVTLDIIMPNSEGVDVLRRILALDPQAKVVVISALNQTRLISEAIRAGAQDFIAKPFMPERLQETVAACVDELASV